MQRILSLAIFFLVAGLGIYTSTNDGIFVPGLISAYFLLMILPGAGLYLLAEKNPSPLELVLSSIVLSPILVGLAAVLVMAFGVSTKITVFTIASASTILGGVALLSRPESYPDASSIDHTRVSGRQALILAGVILLFCALAGFLPLTSEWWRMWSDAWFHYAVVEQINDYGIPPEDPFFLGIPLQYMWFYHVLTLVISRATNIHSSFVTTLLNIQAMFGFVIATYLLSVYFRKRFSHGISSVFMAVLGLNALFWFFLPIKLGRALTGEVRGMEEISRLLSLTPFDQATIRPFLMVFSSRAFFISKFIVMTPFSLGLCFMAAAWYGMVNSCSHKRAFPIMLAFFASAGMLAFHTIVGITMLAGFLGGLILPRLKRSRMDPAAVNVSLKLFIVLIVSVIILSPYLYLVLYGKESSHLVPLGFSFRSTLAIFVSCALGFLLTAFQLKKLLAERTPEMRFFIFASLSIIVFCLFVILPGSNKYDKPPFFIFYPLSVVGGWTLAELPQRGKAFLRNKIFIFLIFVVLFLPTNLLGLLAYSNTQTEPILSPWEREVTTWVQSNTSRDAIFIDSNDHVFLLVTGPRRYYFGVDAYANLWGYDKEEMDRRRRVIDNLYSTEPLASSTLSALSEIDPAVYVITRDTDGEPGGSSEKLLQIPDLMSRVFSSGPISVLKVNKAACRKASGAEHDAFGGSSFHNS